MRNQLQIMFAVLFLFSHGPAQAQVSKEGAARPKVSRPATKKARKARPARRRNKGNRKDRAGARKRPKPTAGAPKDAPAAEPKAAPQKAPPRVTPSRTVKVISGPVVKGRPRIKAPAGTADFLGRLHLVLVHLPIGWLLLLLLVDLGTFGLKLREWIRAGALVLFGTFISLVPTVITGFIRMTYLSTPANQDLLMLHRNLSLGLVAVILLAFLERIRSRNKLQGPTMYFYLALLVTAVVLLALSSYLGAQISFGRNILFGS